MLARVKSGALRGVDAYIVEVEVDIAGAAFLLYGGPARGGGQGEQGPGAAIKNAGYQFPPRITVNLAPADIKKEGSAFDLPIAVGSSRPRGSSRLITCTTISFWVSSP